MQKLYIVKIGSNIIDDSAELQQFLQTFADLSSPKILIHGGGKLSSELSLQLGIVPMMVDGRRITDEQTLDVVVMTYAGLINKKLLLLCRDLVAMPLVYAVQMETLFLRKNAL